ncbi:excalibur calcium-binding domain-containing protein [Nonomuraea sp. NPDC050663]|uniref:excalibur calcium-binding domain-containing protein n=1 Tax=Nonomuraea sp. NPDC050663 TaxID=3364370 RepID=UPI00379BF8B7
MENPPPVQVDEAEDANQASKFTTIVLLSALVLVIVTAGVLGTVAVLMTRNPDSPLLGGKKPVQLAQGIHFAPVTETKPTCPGEQAATDAKSVCYFLAEGVTVTAVQKIETVSLAGGTYGVRIAFAPAFLERMTNLTEELARAQQQLAVVLVDNPQSVLAAPLVTQALKGDSLMITGFTKAEADVLRDSLLGSAAATSPPLPTPLPTPTFMPSPSPAAPSVQVTVPAGGLDRRFASCQEAIDNGYGGPYTKGVHPEYTWYQDKDNNGVACNPGDF